MKRQYPKFRNDLTIPDTASKARTGLVVLHDPLTGKFFRLSAAEYEFLRLFDGDRSIEEALEAFSQKGRLLSNEEGLAILQRASSLGLLFGTKYSSAEFQTRLKKQAQQAKKSRLLSNMYFLYIPLWNPDKFLERTVWIYRLIANRWTVFFTLLLLPGAFYLLIADLPRIHSEILFFFNLENMIFLWITLAMTKMIHEFAHAYTAKNYGLYVPRMGIAFLLFFPCLYCDTTDAWRLAGRKERMSIAAAGIVAEAAVAIFSVYVWHFTRPGMLNSLAFYLMAVSFISTVLFNGNPLMKFDGYFILTDFLGITNLQAKSVQELKYLFMNRTLGLGQFTSPATGKQEQFLFTFYGISIFLYRIFLYIGIVAGVYYRFDKLLGLILAMVAAALFIVRPVVKGLKTIKTQGSAIQLQYTGFSILILIAVVILIPLLIPISSKSEYPCYLGSAEIQKLTVPFQTSVSRVNVRVGDFIDKGSIPFRLDSSILKLNLVKATYQQEIIRDEIVILRLDNKTLGKALGKEAELFHAKEEVKRIKDDLRRATEGMVAPFNGVITSLDYRVQPGYRPGEGAIVGEIQSPSRCVVRALIPEKDLYKISPGQDVLIWFPILRGKSFNRRVESVKPYSESDLTDSPFSSRFGGTLATEMLGERQKDAPLEAQYTCSVDFPNETERIPLGMTGLLVVHSPRQSLLSRFIDSVYRTFNRESLL